MTEGIVDDLRVLNFEVERAHHSWSIFLQSVREFEPAHDVLIAALDSRNIGPTVNFLQLVLLHDCVACICRVTDEHKPDRITLNSVMIDLRSKFSQNHSDEIKKLDEKRKSIAKSVALAELRIFRNHQIGHTLRKETPQTTYKSIPSLTNDLFDFLDDAFRLCGDARWIGQMTSKKVNSLATEFWDCVELGAQVRGERSKDD